METTDGGSERSDTVSAPASPLPTLAALLALQSIISSFAIVVEELSNADVSILTSGFVVGDLFWVERSWIFPRPFN